MQTQQTDEVTAVLTEISQQRSHDLHLQSHSRSECDICRLVLNLRVGIETRRQRLEHHAGHGTGPEFSSRNIVAEWQ